MYYLLNKFIYFQNVPYIAKKDYKSEK